MLLTFFSLPVCASFPFRIHSNFQQHFGKCVFVLGDTLIFIMGRVQQASFLLAYFATEIGRHSAAATGIVSDVNNAEADSFMEFSHHVCRRAGFSIKCTKKHDDALAITKKNLLEVSKKNESHVNADISNGPTPHEFPVFQVFRTVPEKLMEHNAKFLPDNAAFYFYDDHEGLNGAVKSLSADLEKAGVVTGFYEAFSMMRPIALQVDLFRVAALWRYGGLYMDHKVVLAKKLSSFVQMGSHEDPRIFLPVDSTYVDYSGHIAKCCFQGRRGVQNAFLYSSAPRHPYWEYVIRKQVSNIQKRFYGNSGVEPTG